MTGGHNLSSYTFTASQAVMMVKIKTMIDEMGPFVHFGDEVDSSNSYNNESVVYKMEYSS